MLHTWRVTKSHLDRKKLMKMGDLFLSGNVKYIIPEMYLQICHPDQQKYTYHSNHSFLKCLFSLI